MSNLTAYPHSNLHTWGSKIGLTDDRNGQNPETPISATSAHCFAITPLSETQSPKRSSVPPITEDVRLTTSVLAITTDESRGAAIMERPTTHGIRHTSLSASLTCTPRSSDTPQVMHALEEAANPVPRIPDHAFIPLPLKSPARYKQTVEQAIKVQTLIGHMDARSPSVATLYRPQSPILVSKLDSEDDPPGGVLNPLPTRADDALGSRNACPQRIQALKKQQHFERGHLKFEESRPPTSLEASTADIADPVDDTTVLSRSTDPRSFSTPAITETLGSASSDGSHLVTVRSSRSIASTRYLSTTFTDQLHLNKRRYPQPHAAQRTRYISHRTQNTNAEKPPITIHPSPPVTPDASLFELQGDNRIFPVNPTHPKNHTDSRPPISPNPTQNAIPQALEWYLNEMELRFEARVSAYETRAALLETALLAITNSFATLGCPAPTTVRIPGREIDENNDAYEPSDLTLEAVISNISRVGR